jgi:hypothetical protein
LLEQFPEYVHPLIVSRGSTHGLVVYLTVAEELVHS